jgi:hypothetical protein
MVNITLETVKNGGKSTFQFASDPESLVDKVRDEIGKEYPHTPETQMSQILNFAASIQDVIVRNNPLHLKCAYNWADYAAFTSMTIEVS